MLDIKRSGQGRRKHIRGKRQRKEKHTDLKQRETSSVSKLETGYKETIIMTKKKYWIQKAVNRRKKGALSRQLGIPEKDNIPKTLLEKIAKTPVGGRIKNPTKTGKKYLTVTRKLKKRAVLALTLKKLRKRR